MYFKIISEKHTFQHNTSSKILCGLPISLRKVLLFYSNGRYFQYDLCESKILNSWTLLEKPVKMTLSGLHQAIIITESRKLIELNLEKNACLEICKLPRIITGNEAKDRSTFSHSDIVPFVKTSTFYIRELVEDENKIRVIYFNQQREMGHIKEFENICTIIEPIDEYSKIAVYRQTSESDGKWEVRIIDLQSNFQERKYTLEHKAMVSGGVVVKTLLKSEGELFVFINGQNPEILVLDLERGDVRQLNYKPQPNLVDVGFYGGNKQILCLFYIHSSENNGEIYENLLEVVDVEASKLIQKSYLTIRNPVFSLSNQFILDIPSESNAGNTSKFFTRHFIKKKSLYFDLLTKTQIREMYGDKLCATVIRLLEAN